MSLDTNVYKLPSFSEKSFQLDRQERKDAERKLNVEGVEDAYISAKHTLKGDFAKDASLLYDSWAEASTTALQTRSDADMRKAKEIKAQLDLVIGAGRTQAQFASKQYEQALANQFEGYAMSKEDIEKGYTSFNNRAWESKVENGRLMVKEGDTFVPASQSSLYSSTPNPNNTYMIPKAVEAGKYFLVDSYMNRVKSVSGASSEEKLEKIYADFDYMLKTPSFASDVAMHYYVNDLNLADGTRGYSADDRREAEKRFAEDENYRAKAIESYKKEIEAKSGVYLKGSREGYGEDSKFAQKVDGKDVVFVPLTKKTNTMVALGQDADGNYYKAIDLGVGQLSYVPADQADIAVVEAAVGKMPTLFEKKEETAEEEVTAENQVTGEKMDTEATEEVPDIELPEPAKEEQTTEGFGGLGLNLQPPGQQQTQGQTPARVNQTGTAPPADYETGASVLPDWYYDNLIKFEGGISTDKDDNAWALNPDAPKVNGKRAHTNRGVQWNVFKNFAKRNGVPESQWEDSFLQMDESTAKAIVDDYAKASGASNFKDPVLRSFFTQNSWGTGKVWAADFKKGRSADYRAVLDWLQGETGLDFANTGKINKEEADAIEELYNKDPEKFIKTFADKKEKHFKKLDDYNKYGDGWINRLRELESEALASLQ